MKDYLLHIKLHIFILLVAPLIGLLALLVVYLLPTAPMKEHVYWSLDMIEQEFTSELLVDGYPATLTGNFTDCLMLEHAVYTNKEHSILEQVLRMFRSETYNVENDPDGWWPGQSLADYLNGISQPREVEYARYWHGYLVLLKPLLFLTSFNTIRLLNSAIQLILVGLVVIGLCKRNAPHIAIAYLLSLPFMFFVSTYASLSLSICFYIMNICLIAMLTWDSFLQKRKYYGLFFLLTGICTSYFDFLTYPLITLAYPLCLYFLLHKATFLHAVNKMISLCFEWTIGYIWMWSSKWILTDLLTDTATIQNATETILARTTVADNTSLIGGLLSVYQMNLQPFMNWCHLLLLFMIMVYVVLKLCKKKFRISGSQLPNGTLFFLIAVIPFVWYAATQNHSMEHWQFTCRIISATVFAGTIGIFAILETTD